MQNIGILVEALAFAALGAFLVLAPEQVGRLSRVMPIIRWRQRAATSLIGLILVIVSCIVIVWWLILNL